MTALDTIYWMQKPICSGRFIERCRFEALIWACVLAAAGLGMNFNDGRYPDLRAS